MMHKPYTQEDFTRNPLMFYYEVTRACDLVCKHCRASAQETPAEDELSTETSLALIDQVASFPRKPTMCFTGGDPLKRKDLFQLIERAVSHGIQTALTPSATPLATRDAFVRAKDAGVHAIGISLDGPNADVHDSFRGFSGSFEQTLKMLGFARELGLPVQVNTSITRRNFAMIDEIADLLENQDIAMWSVFFLIPIGRGVDEQRIKPEEYEIAFARLWKHAQTKPFSIKTTEAPHYRRYVLEQGGNPLKMPSRFGGSREKNSGNSENMSTGHPDAYPMSSLKHLSESSAPIPTAQNPTAQNPTVQIPTAQNSMFKSAMEECPEVGMAPKSHTGRAPLGVIDGRGIMFMGHNGIIFPAGFLPINCGRFPEVSVVDVYQNHPVFRQLQNPDNFKGRCGACEYRFVCGGSRARAFAVEGDYLGSEPDCIYQIGQKPLIR